MCTVAAASGAASVRVWHITSRGWDPWTERPLPEVVRVAYPPDAVHNHFLLSRHPLPLEPSPNAQFSTGLVSDVFYRTSYGLMH